MCDGLDQGGGAGARGRRRRRRREGSSVAREASPIGGRASDLPPDFGGFPADFESWAENTGCRKSESPRRSFSDPFGRDSAGRADHLRDEIEEIRSRLSRRKNARASR